MNPRRRTFTQLPVVEDISSRVIHLKERSLVMLKQDLILRNPLRLLGKESDDILEPGQFGAILARAGVGKTALIIQIALNAMLRAQKVLHISLNEPVGKINIWYQEVLGRLAQKFQIPHLDQLWDTIVPHRFIMTFQAEGFSVPKLEERLTDLTSQNIFNPRMMLIDGLAFDQQAVAALQGLKQMAHRLSLPIWFTVTTHRHEAPAPDGLPVQLSAVQNLFEMAVALLPVEQTIQIKALKGCSQAEAQPPLHLDPETMLIQDRG
ncbi:MAG: cytoplasmic protein [Desulfobacteraceae bacterium]|nr:cytoplasmic protein [Desulfobacteraceae bacterium]